MDAILKGSNSYRRVVQALAKSGYVGDQGITSARFVGMNARGSEIHLITFPDPETGEQADGYVYIDQNGNGDF